MYRSHGASCPSCHGALTPLPTTLTMWGCFTCSGVWLGPEAAVHVLRGLGDEVEKDLAAASAETERRSFAPAPDSGSRECSICGLVMAHVLVSEIVIDSCPTHGCFFDRDECKRLSMRAGGSANAGSPASATARATLSKA